jgi:ribokinase
MQVAHAQSRLVVLNPAPATAPLPRHWFDVIDYLIPNEVEASALSGVYVDSPESALRAAKALQQQGAGHVIITLGQQGIVVLGEGDKNGQHYPSHEVVAIDATGAGDTFVGGFCAALAAKHSWGEAVVFGQAAAALSVTRAGAQTSIPFLDELKSFA